MASIDGKLIRMGHEILKATRRGRVLEERVLLGLNAQVRLVCSISESGRERHIDS